MLSTKKVILYIDDSPTRVELLQLILNKKRSGVEFHTTPSVSEGIEVAQQLKPDLILVCEWLDSSQVDKLYLSRDIVLNNTPIIALGSRWDKYKSKGFDLPSTVSNPPLPNAYLEIPYDVEQLLQTIDRFLS